MTDDPQRSLKVFLCHASADKPAVRDLYKRLVADGVDAWLDAESLVPGQNWQVEIPKAIREVDVVLVCLSEKSINKEGYVQKEIKFALDVADEKPEGTIFIIPARLEECKVPDRLSMYHWVDLFEANGYPKLMGALHLRADKIGAVLQTKKSWLGGMTLPIKKSETQKPKPVVKPQPKREPEEPKPVPVRKPLRKWNTRMIAVAAGIVVIFAAIFGLPWNQGFVTDPDVATVTPTIHTPTTTMLLTTSTPTLTPTPTPRVGSTMIGEKGETLVYVTGGNFDMGNDSSDAPVHTVYLAAFWIDQTEVTNAMYEKCVNERVCKEPTSISSYKSTRYYGNSKFDNYPVIYVNWDMAKTYCDWAGGDLPTEAQWEKAALGTYRHTYPWGEENISCYIANYQSGCLGDTSSVGSYKNGKSPYNAWDMAGNVWEWVSDWYSDNYYQNSPFGNPLGPDSGQYRVMRGGAWGYVNYSARSADRNKSNPTTATYNIGFRCVHSAP